jgi:hypothetical protein
VDVVALDNDIAEVDADAELDPLIGRRDSRVTLDHCPLHFDRAAHSIHDTRELRQQAVAGVLHDPAPMLFDLRIDKLHEMGFEPLVCAFLIGTH